MLYPPTATPREDPFRISVVLSTKELTSDGTPACHSPHKEIEPLPLDGQGVHLNFCSLPGRVRRGHVI